jgi:hypothetical protein
MTKETHVGWGTTFDFLLYFLGSSFHSLPFFLIILFFFGPYYFICVILKRIMCVKWERLYLFEKIYNGFYVKAKWGGGGCFKFIFYTQIKDLILV